MNTEIQVKRVKLEDNNLDALIKSKWTESSIDFEILVREKNLLLTASYDKEELEKKKLTKVSFDILFKALSAADMDENYRYKVDNHFLLYKVEPLDDDDVYEIIFMRLPNLKKTQLTEETTKILTKQLEDLAILCDKYDNQKSLLKMCEVDIEKLNDQYFLLAKEKENYEKKVVAKCLELLNEKKKVIRDGMGEKCIADDSSFDIHEFILNDGLRAISPKKEHEEFPKVDSPVASTSRFAVKSITPKSSTPSQKPKRTPSKRLFTQINQPSDSDESLDILPFSEEKSKKRKSPDNPDTSSIFKDFKVNTPKKPKREEKESSVEAKKDNSEPFNPRHVSSPSEIESRSSRENANRNEKIYSNPLDVFLSEDMIYSQALGDDLNSSDSYKTQMNLRSKKKKNPYSLETSNILDM